MMNSSSSVGKNRSTACAPFPFGSDALQLNALQGPSDQTNAASQLPVEPFNLSDESARRDVFGNSNLPGELKGSLADATKLFQDALELIPDKEKAAYLEAMKRCPKLVAQESSPTRFLRFDNWNPWSAARRHVDYWEQRHDIFQERAFLPMIQTGEGALTQDDVKLLDSGFGMLLPPDQHGRLVLCHDRARLTSAEFLDPDKRLRCFFYLLHVASENQDAQTKGIVLLTVYGAKSRATSFDERTLTQTISLFKKESIPLRVKAFHLVMMSKRPILEPVIPITLDTLMQQWPYLRQRTIVHNKVAVTKLLQDLEKYGLGPESLPKVPVGGSWTFGCLKSWRDDRLLHEKRIQAASLTSAALSEAVDKLQDEEETRKRRQADAVYARRKRTRQKIEMEVMQEQVERLEKQQRHLKEAGQLLEEQLAQAKMFVEISKRASGCDALNAVATSSASAQSLRGLGQCTQSITCQNNITDEVSKWTTSSPLPSSNSSHSGIQWDDFAQKQALLEKLQEHNMRVMKQRQNEMGEKIIGSFLQQQQQQHQHHRYHHHHQGGSSDVSAAILVSAICLAQQRLDMQSTPSSPNISQQVGNQRPAFNSIIADGERDLQTLLQLLKHCGGRT